MRSSEDFLIFGSPRIEEEEIEEVVSCLHSGWLSTGPKVMQFEDAFKAYKQASHAVAVNSCTAALHLSMLAADIGRGDEVITTPMTFCATVNAILHSGATPVLADIDPVSMNIDPKEIEARMTPKTRAIVPVHFAGRPCDMDAILAIANKHDLTVIEDCAHAIETEYHGRKAGTIGEFGCFSFYVTKNIVTGEGGMVITKNGEQADRIKILALHGMSKDAWKRYGDEEYKHYYVVECGFKYNMMDLQAAIGIHQLKRVEDYWQRRVQLWQKYDEALKDLPIGLPAAVEPNTRHSHHLFTVLIDPAQCGIERDDFLALMTASGIGVGVHYLCLAEHPYYQSEFGWRPEDYPNATRIGRQIVSLPISAKLTNQDLWDVIDSVTTALTAPIRLTNTV